MLLGAETSNVLYPLVLAAAGLIVVVLALAKLVMHLRRIALDRDAGPTATGLTLQQIEQMYERGQISRQEFSLLRRKALADVIGPDLPAKPPSAAGAPTPAGQEPSQPSPPAQRASAKEDQPLRGQAGQAADVGIPELDASVRALERRQREDNAAIRMRKLFQTGLVTLLAGLVWLGMLVYRPSGPSRENAPAGGMQPGPVTLPAQSTQPSSRMTPWSFLSPASGPTTPASPPTQPAAPR